MLRKYKGFTPNAVIVSRTQMASPRRRPRAYSKNPKVCAVIKAVRWDCGICGQYKYIALLYSAFATRLGCFLSLHKQHFVTAHSEFITAHFVFYCTLKNALLCAEFFRKLLPCIGLQFLSFVFTAQCTLVHIRGLGIACRLSVGLSVCRSVCL